MKSLGYSTGQFGKNHLGDRNEYLPTVHGFDVFYGNLYHLNAEEEPERPYWPKDDTAYTSTNSPRGVLRCKATDKDDATESPIGGVSANNPAKIPGHLLASGWRRLTTKQLGRRSTTSTLRSKPANRSSFG